MFDISFTELMLIGIVALIVIGPERLPRVARTLGHLIGRAQRYVGDVKSDIQREMEIDQLKDLKGQMEEAAKSVKTSVKEATDTLRDPLEDARKALQETSDSVDSMVKSTQDELNTLAKSTQDEPGDISRAGQDELNALSEAATKLNEAESRIHEAETALESIPPVKPLDTSQATDTVSKAPSGATPPPAAGTERPLSDAELADRRLAQAAPTATASGANTSEPKPGTPL